MSGEDPAPCALTTYIRRGSRQSARLALEKRFSSAATVASMAAA